MLKAKHGVCYKNSLSVNHYSIIHAVITAFLLSYQNRSKKLHKFLKAQHLILTCILGL